MHWLGMGAGALVIIIGIFMLVKSSDSNLPFFLIGLGAAIIVFPFIVDLAIENKRDQQINEMFLEFSRNLAESVMTGTPVSKSIINMRGKNYGLLTPHVGKLANQISLGIPVSQALQTFARDVDSRVISRAIGLISEAERAGGEIDYILDSVSRSIAEVEKLKKERRAAISSLVVQGYIIFFIFIGIMLVMQFKILPLTVQVGSFSGISSGGGIESDITTQSALTANSIARLFLYLLLVQGFFTGLTVGKLAEGTLRAGIKHSFILMISAFLISTGVQALI